MESQKWELSDYVMYYSSLGNENYILLFEGQELISNWDDWLTYVEQEMKNKRYTKYKQDYRNSTFQFWKTIKRKDEKLYQIGMLVYDYRDFYGHIGVQHECIISGKGIFLSVSETMKVSDFEKMAKKFYTQFKYKQDGKNDEIL